MTEPKERTVQDVFDDERKNDNRIEEIKEEIEELTSEYSSKYCSEIKTGDLIDLKSQIEELKEQLSECKKKIKVLKKERQTLAIDLLEDGKLEWVECNLNEWREYVEENVYDPAKYYIYRYDGGIRQQGFYKGEFKLDIKDEEHFREYFDDYFYYGCPNYQDENHPNADGSECYLAFGGGAAGVTSFEWH